MNISFKGFTPHKLFKGAKAPSIADFKKIADVVNTKLDGTLASDLADKVRQYAPKLVDLEDRVQNPHLLRAFGDAISKPFKEVTGLVIQGLKKIAPKSEVVGRWSQSYVKYLENKQDKLYERAGRGIYQWGSEFIKKAQDKGNVSKEIEKGFFGEFAKNLAFDKASYNSVTERTGVRFVSGMIPALFLGYDFRNKAIRDGATPKEADKEAAKKRGQEVIAGLGETAAQYTILSGFPAYVNNSTMGAPIINTLINIFFHITSRLSKGMPLKRIKIEDNQTSSTAFKSATQKIETKNEDVTDTKNSKQKEKKPLLSLKNIGLLCLASIGVGTAWKFGAPKLAKTKLGESFIKNIKEPVQKWFKNITTEQLWVSQEDLNPFFETLEKTGNKKTFKHYSNILTDIFDTSTDKNLVRTIQQGTENIQQINLGNAEKTFKLFGVEITKKNLYTIPLAPLKLVKEILSFPYKAFEKIMQFAGVKKFQPTGVEEDALNGLIHFFRDFKKHSERFTKKGLGEEKFISFYKDHLAKNAIKTLDREGCSKINNASVGKITQLLGTVGGIYFATTDDFNRTAKRTGNKKQAQKDARERGVNKFMRITSQIVLMDIFNNTFKIPYAQSLLGAFGITAACTLATEKATRLLSGMPSKKIETKEELKAHKEKQQNGAFGWYFKAVDKLSE